MPGASTDVPQQPAVRHDDPVSRWQATLEGVIGTPFTTGNRVDRLKNGNEIFPAMLDAIESATRSVDLLTFIYWSGVIGRRFAEALSERAQAGVRVRVLLDAVGSRKIEDDLVQMMEEAGCHVRWFRPVNGSEVGEIGNRTHRKVLVVDECIGFTGGVGIADPWTGDARNPDEWRDTHVQVEGPAVDGLRGAFIDDWFETGPVDLFDEAVDECADVAGSGPHTVQVVKGSAGAGHTDIATLIRLLVDRSRRSLKITAAYFTPAEAIEGALVAALERGVEVEIVVPGPHADKRFMRLASEATFSRLAGAGARIHSFQPTMIHAKVVIADDEVATIGSANFDNRAVQHDDEVNLVLFDQDLVDELVAHFHDDVSRSEEIDPERWEGRGVLQRAKEAVVDAVSDVL